MPSTANSTKDMQKMFGKVAKRYDFLNALLSLGIDSRWRKMAARCAASDKPSSVLDMATGTADMALELAALTDHCVRIVGMDVCREMIDMGRIKVRNSAYSGRITFTIAGCENIPFADGSFGSVAVAFGIRNVMDRNEGLREIYRVLKKGGSFVILEFSNPKSKVMGQLYGWYFQKILPMIGGFFSDRKAYRYLPDSVFQFPSQEKFKALLETTGFVDVVHTDLTFGIATVYHARKP